MKMKIIAGLLTLCTIVRCTSYDTPAAFQLTVVNSVTWVNLCKRVTLRPKDAGGSETSFGTATTLQISVTGAASVFSSNHCSGTPVQALATSADATEAAFFVKAGATGTVTVTLSFESMTASVDLSSGVPGANLVLGQPDFTTGTVNTGGRSATTMNQPWAVARCDDALVVADEANHRVLIWNAVPTSNGAAANVVIGQADFSSAAFGSVTSTSMHFPDGIVCAGGKLYVSDYVPKRVLVFNSLPTSNVAAASAVWGQPDLTTGGAQALSATHASDPVGLSYSDGTFLLGDGNRFLVWNTPPVSSADAADFVLGAPDFTTAGGGSTASLYEEAYFAQRAGDFIFVADHGNNRVLILNAKTISSGMPATRVLGQSSLSSSSSGSSASGLSEPRGVVWDGDHLWVADYGNRRILIWNGMPDSNGKPADVVIGAAGFTAGTGAATTTTGHYFYLHLASDAVWAVDLDNNRVLRFQVP